MGEEVAISLKNVSKCYKRYAHPVDRLKEILLPGKSRAQEFWALRDINLEVLQGETLGLIGHNGSGKSTLLQIVAGTLTPTTGEVTVKGRIAALLELGSGFNPEFTGRQNVFFNGQLLGLSQKELEDKFDSIAAFADIGDFLDQPVKTYSSGMFVRLAFAVAVSVEPNILIVDEALAVGDIFFQQKCFERIRRLKDSGTTILFVSHDTAAVYRLCSKAILLEMGIAVLHASARQVIDLYEAKLLKKIDSQPEAVEIKLISKPNELDTQDIKHSSEEIGTHFKPDLPESQELGLSSENNNNLEGIVIRTDTQTEAVGTKLLSKPNWSEAQELVASNNMEEVVMDSRKVSLEFIKFLDENNQEIQSVISEQLIQLSIGVSFLEAFNDPHIGFQIRDRTGFVVFNTCTFWMGQKIGQVEKGIFIETRF